MKIKDRLKSIFVFVLIASFLFAFSACNNSGNVSGIELDRGSITLNVGETTQLTMYVLPEYEENDDGSWLTSDAKVATVEKGLITAKAQGTALIRASYGGQRAVCTVNVVDPNSMTRPVLGISLNAQRVELKLGEGNQNTFQLVPTITPENATDKTLTWSSADDRIATVDDNGLVTAVSSGTVAVGCVSNNSVSARCVVVVYNEDGTLDGGSAISNDPVYIDKVASLSTRSEDSPFIMAMDASEVLSVEQARTKSLGSPKFKNFDGEEEDVFKILKDNGITDIRVRVWNNPNDAEGNSYGGGNCDVDNAVAISERCKAVGLGVIIDFHYSDFWADPGKQYAPKAWKDMSLDDKVDALGAFTESALEQIKAKEVKITMVQIGNETTGGLAGETGWTNICKLMNAGSAAIRKVAPEAKIAVHFTNAGDNTYVSKAQTLKDNGVDYDVFGSSWYPYYTSHGTLNNLMSQFRNIHEEFGKDVMVLETAYAFTHDDADGLGNTALEASTQPITVQGMSNAVRDVIKAVADLGDYGLGVSYWGGTWIAASESTEASVNRALCKEFGCGWATASAKGYDSSANDGGTMVDNNAFWLSDGTPIQALKVFQKVYEGQYKSLEADYIEDEEVYCTVNEGPIVLPENVKVVLNNGNTIPELKAVWNCTDEELAQYITEVGMHEIIGTTEFGGTAHLYVWVMYPNILTAGSFEDDENINSYGAQNGGSIHLQATDIGDWNVRYTNSNSGDLQLYISNESQNAMMGTNSFHFWDSKTVNFKLYQTFEKGQLSSYGNGAYGASFEIQGGHGANMKIYAYITVTYANGDTKTFEGNKVDLTVWQEWHRTAVSGVTIDDTVVSVEVGINVYAEAIEDGPWGNIDNCQFYFEG